MKTYIERQLERIQKIADEKNEEVSCDLYYNDLAVRRREQFVAKLFVGVGTRQYTKHFRTNHIRKSLKQAVEYMEGL